MIDYIFHGPPTGGVSGPAVALDVTNGQLYYTIPSIAGWVAISSGATGTVVGPVSAANGDFAQFDGTTGALIKDGGLSLDTNTALGTSDVKLPSQKAVKTYVDANAPVLVKATTQLSSADILTLDTVPVLVVPAPPSGFFNVPILVSMVGVQGSSAYSQPSGGTRLTVGSGTIFSVCPNTAITTFISGAQGLKSVTTFFTNSEYLNTNHRASTVVDGVGIYMNSTSAITTGNGTLAVTVSYYVVAL